MHRGSQVIAVGEANEGHTLSPLNVAGSVTPLKNWLLIEHLRFPGNFGFPTPCMLQKDAIMVFNRMPVKKEKIFLSRA